jgi:hypothetical protein
MPSLSRADPVEDAEADRRRDGDPDADALLLLRLCRVVEGRLEPDDRLRVWPFSLVSGCFGFLDKDANHSWSVI